MVIWSLGHVFECSRSRTPAPYSSPSCTVATRNVIAELDQWSAQNGLVEDPDCFLRLGDMREVCLASQKKKAISQEYTKWLMPIPWQIFCTLTFAWPVSDSQACGIFAAFVNRMERDLRCPLTYVRGDEKRFANSSEPGAPRHYHALFAAPHELDPSWMAKHWRTLAGSRANAVVRIYDSCRNALGYTLKLISSDQGNWEFRNLELFFGQFRPVNCRARRRIFRSKQRLYSPIRPKRDLGHIDDVPEDGAAAKCRGKRQDQRQLSLHTPGESDRYATTLRDIDSTDHELNPSTRKRDTVGGHMVGLVLKPERLEQAIAMDKLLRARWTEMKNAEQTLRKASIPFGKLCEEMRRIEAHKYIPKPGSRKGYLSFEEYVSTVTGGQVSKSTLYIAIACYKLTQGPNAITPESIAEMPGSNAYELCTKLKPEQRTTEMVEAAKKTSKRDFPAKIQAKLNESLPPERQKPIQVDFFRRLHPTVANKLEETIERFKRLPVVRDGDEELTVQEKAIYTLCLAAEQFASEALRVAEGDLPVLESSTSSVKDPLSSIDDGRISRISIQEI